MRLDTTKFALLLLLFFLFTFPLSAQKNQPDIERKINLVLSKMTFAEKLGQLQQLDGEANGKYRPEHLELARNGLLGSTLNGLPFIKTTA